MLRSVIAVERVQEATPEVCELIAELDADLAQHYSDDQRHGLNLAAIFQPHVRFFIARGDGKPVGCGGVALFDEFAEVKRMYVRPEARGTGVAEAILSQLAEEASQAGLNLLRLETGIHQVAAIRFYERCGFTQCDAFEPYSSMPPEAISTSYFMEKRL